MSTTSPQREMAAAVAAPLSWQQEQIWVHGQWAGAAALYQEAITLRRQSGFQAGPLQAMLAGWMARHAILRTAFTVVAGAPEQRVAAAPPALVLAVGDAASEAEARAWAAADAGAPMDLARSPLVRARWARWPEGQALYLTLHHLIFDGATLRQRWLPEWAALYAAAEAGTPLPAPASAPAYAEFARWQRAGGDRATAERTAEHRDFWRRHFAGEWPRLDLGGDAAAPPFAALAQSFALPAELWAGLAPAASAAQATPFMVLLAAFAALLHRLGGQPAVVVGLPAAARGHRQWGRVAGPMVNTLALRLNCDGNPTFAALVRQTRDVLLDALTHEEYPFALALREAPPEGAAAGLEAYFSLQPPGESPPAGWQLTHLDVDAAAAKFPVHLDLEATTGGLRGRCRYQRARVDAALGAALAEHWTVLLEGALPSPHRRLGGLPLLSAAHRRAVLALSRGPEPPLPAGSVAETFARQVAATPDAVALVVLGADGGAAQLPRRELSYAALLQDAERLAQGLHRAGVACGETVGVLLPPSADAVAVFLAVLLVGAAYLPLLPDDPPTCRERQLQASGARWLLGGEASGAWSLSLAALRQPGALPLPLLATRPDATACVMCTSGSTGEPRAVSIPHRGIVRLVCQPGYARFGPDESYLLLAPLGFDAATFEIWAPLLNGGRLVIPPPGLPAPADLEAIILREGVTTLWLTTTLFNTIIETAPQALAPLRQLLTGGEVMSPRHARQALQQLPGLALFNAYGPTENTTFTTIHRLSGIAGPIPLGRPIAHTAAYVVDDYGALAPQGVAGELWIGGAGLAAGVAGGAAEVQFACPDWAGGQRLFRSGDRMRWQDGELAFLGRRDQQIKLRGRRIELAAIEALLARHPGVRQAAVLASGAGADQVLTAYVAGVGISKQSLRAFLLAELPLAMIPTRWVMRPELPQSVHGKLDRQRLPALAETAAPASAAPAQSATEQRLVAIWRQALGRDGIGREDDFYALGGHSLQALRIVAQIEREFGRRLSLAAWPAHRTIAAQAAWIAGATAPQAADPRAVPLQIGDPARPCVYSLEAGDYFLRLAEQMGPQQPWWSLRLASLTALPHPSSMAAVAAYHAATLRRLQPTGPYYLAGWCQNGVVAFELARQLRAAGEHVACVVLVDAVSPAYLRRVAGLTWPVFRTRYAAHQWCQRQRNRRDPRLGPEPRPQVPPPAAVWRRWRYRWRHPSDPPRLGEPAAVVQYALRAYRPGPYPGRIVLFRSEHQILAAPTMGRFRDPAMGWQELAGAGLEIHEIDGDHMRIFSPPGVGQMARRLAAILARPQLRPVAGRAEAA